MPAEPLWLRRASARRDRRQGQSWGHLSPTREIREGPDCNPRHPLATYGAQPPKGAVRATAYTQLSAIGP